MLRRLSGKSDEGSINNSDDESKNAFETSKELDCKEASEKKFAWNPLNYIRMSSDVGLEDQNERRDPITEGPQHPIAMKGRIILYTRLGCQECKEARLYLYMKRLKYVEINIDVYPSRKQELEKISGSTSVPKVFFNEILIGGLDELMALDKSGRLDEKIEFLITEAPSVEAPLPPLSGEDDESSSGVLDEMALIVSKMKEFIVVKDRFYKMRRFTNCFLGSEAVDFLSEDQYLERPEAVEFARNLASNFFFQHVLDENLFEDGNQLYRFLDDDPIVTSQCQNIPRGITTVKPKPIAEIASRLRFLSYAIFETYASEDGLHVNYRSLHGSEEFARYLRIVEELQRVEIWDMSREEKLAFFINLYNMMSIHAILAWGHPAGALERRKLFGDFKYVIGGSTYSLSAIQNGILRGNQRPPYNLMKPFGAKDKRSRVALPYPEPLVHFALVCGSRSGPALRCYSPRDIDKELMDAARNFLRNGGLVIDLNTKVACASKILKWFSVDFGKNDAEVLKHVSNYLDPADSAVLLDLLASSELKLTYYPYDWGLNC
ncbi:electron carrier/protein disulfide oxidoreductase [Senna tora]|uniref:Electron carrier/protein disulfide oxidoreductase n=1 Tax=Senna tora TaxID=362788 RepID=A0A834T8A9_9FABA|nr:electron carrier/protein disulfide oxidoreductase [Senna tora]